MWSRRPHRAHVTLGSRWSHRTGKSLRADRARRTRITFGSDWARVPFRPYRPGITLRSGWTRGTGGACGAFISLRPRRPRRTRNSLRPRWSRRPLPRRANRHVEGPAILLTIPSDNAQEVGSVGDRTWQEHHQLRVSRTQHRHQVVFTPDLRCLRAEAKSLNSQRLIHTVNGRAQNDDLVRLRGDRGRALLGVRELRPQYHN